MTPLERTTESLDTSGSPPPDRSLSEEADFGGSRTRRTSFRILAVLTSLWVLALMVFGLTEVVLMWLPEDTLVALLGDGDLGDLEAHRSHFMSIGIAAWALMLAVVVQVRRPHRREAAMVWAVAVAVSCAVLFALSGTVEEWLLADVTILVLVLTMAGLHPRARDLRRRPDRDRYMALLAIAAAVPWLAFGATHALRQWRNVTGDIHAEPEHWAIAALMAIAIVVAGIIGASDRTGWLLPAWFAVVASVGYGVHSLVFASAASALAPVWALAANAWALAYAAAIIYRSRHAPSAPEPRPDSLPPP